MQSKKSTVLMLNAAQVRVVLIHPDMVFRPLTANGCYSLLHRSAKLPTHTKILEGQMRGCFIQPSLTKSGSAWFPLCNYQERVCWMMGWRKTRRSAWTHVQQRARLKISHMLKILDFIFWKQRKKYKNMMGDACGISSAFYFRLYLLL